MYISTLTKFKDTAINMTIIANFLLIIIGLVVFQPYTVNRQVIQIALIEFVERYRRLQDEGSDKPMIMRMFTRGFLNLMGGFCWACAFSVYKQIRWSIQQIHTAKSCLKISLIPRILRILHLHSTPSPTNRFIPHFLRI
jgi:hypothetical protein